MFGGPPRLSAEEKGKTAKKFFLGGVCLLPWLWIVNIWFFFGEWYNPLPGDASMSDVSHLHKVKKYVRLSIAGALVYWVLIIGWATLYQLKWQEWGLMGEKLAWTLPEGSQYFA